MSKRKSYEELKPLEPCPCGSRKHYAQCCKKEGIRWERDQRRRIHKSMRMGAELKSALESQLAEFKRLLGRNPAPNDRVFIQQHIHPGAELTLEITSAMKTAGIPGDLVYAYEKTGMILSESNRHVMSHRDVAEFQNAIKEYRQYGKRIEQQRAALELLLQRIQIIFGMMIDKFVNAGRRTWRNRKLSDDFRCYALVSAARNIRAFRVLVERRAEYDALGILRSLYENALVYAHLFRNPTAAETLLARLGLRTGDYAYETRPSGKTNYGWLVNKKSGERVRADISKSQMARDLGEDFHSFHKVAYGRLSDVVHSDMIDYRRHLTDDGMRPYVAEADGEAYFWLFTVCLFLVTEILLDPRLKSVMRRDMKFLGNCIAKELIQLTVINSEAGKNIDPIVLSFLDYLFKAMGMISFGDTPPGTADQSYQASK